MSTRQAQRDDTRRLIMEAAAGQFAVRGYEGTSFATIATAMGRPKSAIGYHQFRSKHELAGAIVTGQRQVWLELGRSAEAAQGPGLRTLIQLFDDVRDDFQTSPLAAGAARLILEDRELGLGLPAGEFSWRRFTTEQLTAAIASGALDRDADAAELTAAFLSAALGVYGSVRSGVQIADPELLLGRLWRDTLAGAGMPAHEAEGLLAQFRPLRPRPADAL